MHQLRAVLNHYPPDCQPAQIEPLGSAGGMSGAQFWRITIVRGTPDPAPVVRASLDPAQTPHTLILRRWPAEHPTPERLQFIHAMLDHAQNNGVTFLPVPIKTMDGRSFVDHAGHLWELAPWLPGTADYKKSPSSAKLNSALVALATLHIATALSPSATGSTAVPNAVIRQLTRLRELAHGGANNLAYSINDAIWPELAPHARQFTAALPLTIPRAIAQLERLANVRLPLQPCLRDIWHDHILFTGDEVTGIVDFGAVDIDTPATDIARLLGSFASPRPCGEGLGEGDFDAPIWREGLAAYSAVRPLSEEEICAVKALDTGGTILAGANWLRWIYIEGRQFEDQEQVIARFRRIVARLWQREPRSGGST